VISGGGPVAVTGAGGFLGRHLVEELIRAGYKVEAAIWRRNLPAQLRVNSTVVDLLDPDAARRWLASARPSRMVHAAWFAEPKSYWTSPDNERWAEASRELFVAAAASGCERIVGIGTCAEYVWDGTTCSEGHTPIHPATPYGRAKDATRAALEEIARTAGISWAWARMFFLFGPHEAASRLVPSVIRTLLRNDTAACTEGLQERDYLYVRDAASALVTLMESGVVGPVNVASGEGIAIRALVDRLVVRVGSGRVAFGRLPTPAEPSRLVADITRLTNEVGWAPRIPLDSAIDESIAFEKQRIA